MTTDGAVRFEARTLAIVAVAFAIFAAGVWMELRSEARLRRGRAAVVAAAEMLTYEAVSKAWTDELLGKPSGLRDIEESLPVRWTAAHEDEGAIILVFRSEDTCIDFRPTDNQVRTRDC